MPQLEEAHHVVRIVEGRRGRVPMRMELAIRFDYGSIVPWVRRVEPGISAIAGPDRIRLHTDVELRGVDYRTVAEFDVAEGQRGSSIWSGTRRTDPRASQLRRPAGAR